MLSEEGGEEGLGEGQGDEHGGDEPVNTSHVKHGKHLAQGNMRKSQNYGKWA